MSRKLRAPRGTDEANVDGVLYRVDNDGTIEVPDAAVGTLTHTGGFVVIEEIPPPPMGHVTLIAPDGCTGCSWGGETFVPDGDMRIAVPAPACTELLSHGFVPEHQSGKVEAPGVQ